MGQEIERKYLVKGESWRVGSQGEVYCQGYITREPQRTVRVRIVGEQGYLTIKGATQGITRCEFEYPIPLADARALLDLCDRPFIEKTRYKLQIGDFLWEIDEFHGENQGLILAEVELPDENTFVPLPDWVGEEVSQDGRYYNANLVKFPYKQWF
ncbi:CYTH domain-containing protein [Spirulina subsalsa FACHB-351]|uniref:CYTH domain-containing protein n=1 Tax=Spirulina subsalsa FACHB-351 TaxID=234711 RepID=A0ABT3L4F7_9CYAN|nr:CYTH domain-containing protein [Spirulina subsalsa FACHB-351]